MTTSIPLSTQQVQRFICDGFLVLDSELPPATHRTIHSRLRYSHENEFPMGNNILARIPQMHGILESPRIAGALESLLGADYYLHPHRAVHTSEPVAGIDDDLPLSVDAPPMGKGSLAGSGWHQDAQSPLARARHHVPRYLILFYFPHDTTLRMGPTRLDPGSYLYSAPQPVRNPVVPEHIRAGTVFVVHFDMVHAGFTNRSDATRYMVKFVATRTRQPQARARCEPFAQPADTRMAPDGLPTWDFIWHWLHGRRPVEPGGRAVAERLVAMQADQWSRLQAIYAGPLGPDDIDVVLDHLAAKAGSDNHQRALAKNAAGETIPVDKRVAARRWNERAIVMEDATYLLVAAGPDAAPGLVQLLALDDPWLNVNVAFALGEIGAAASDLSIPALTQLLDHPEQVVVRQALDALAMLGVPFAAALPAIDRLLRGANLAWQERAVLRGWTPADQVRLNAVFALLHYATLISNDGPAAVVEQIEQSCIHALEDPNGYVPEVACETLRRLGSATGIAAAFRHLQARRWDSSLAHGIRTY